MQSYTEILKETDEIYAWLQSLNYTFNSTIMQGTIILNFPNRATLDCVLEEICTEQYANKLLWHTFARTRMVVWHSGLENSK